MMLCQNILRVDRDFRGEMGTYRFLSDSSSVKRRILYGMDGAANTTFDSGDVARFRSHTTWLNDVCINGGAALLQRLFITYPSSQRYALLSTFDVPRVRYKTSDDEL